MNWIAIVYMISTPFAIWIDRSSQDDSFTKRLCDKASSGFKSASWMFDGAYSLYNMFWVVLLGPVVVAFMAVMIIVGVPLSFVYEWITGNELFTEETPPVG